MSLKNTILSVTRRTKKGFTVGEIYERVAKLETAKTMGSVPLYSSVRARVYELADAGLLNRNPFPRKDSTSGIESTVFTRTA